MRKFSAAAALAVVSALAAPGLALAQASTITVPFAPTPSVPISPWALLALAVALGLTALLARRYKGVARAGLMALGGVLVIGVVVAPKVAQAIQLNDEVPYNMSAGTGPITLPVGQSGIDLNFTNNTGVTQVFGASPTISNPGTDAYYIFNNGCTGGIAPSGTCTITIYAPAPV